MCLSIMEISADPKFPLTVTFHEEARDCVFETELELACNLEWFDSREKDENATVIDSLGREVTLVVEKLEVKTCVLA